MNGTLQKVGERFFLRFERSYPHSCEDVWRALVEPESLADWFPAAIEGERRAGAPLRFVFPGGEGPVLEGAMRVFEPPHLLEYTWAEDVLRWELSATPTGCTLVFTTSLQQRSVAARDATGWDGCLDNLAKVIGGKARDKGPGNFRERYAQYVKRFGLGAFPGFLVPPGASNPGAVLPNPALVGTLFTGPRGERFAVLHAAVDGDTAEHALAGDAYLCVVEGEYVLRLGGQELTLGAGTEFHVPGGGKVSGRVKAGTRLLYAVAPATSTD